MKLKSNLLAIAVLTIACSLFADNASARQSGTLPEDNSSTSSIVDDHGGTNSVSGSNSGSNKKGNAKKISEVKIKLVAAADFAKAKGSARSRVRTDKQDLEVEVQGLKSLAGTELGVTVGDTVIGSFTVNALGKGQLELSTENGDTVPAIAPGTLIGVVTGSGTIVFAGSF